MMPLDNFLHLLRLGMGLKTDLAGLQPATEKDWKRIMKMAKKQAVLGVVERGIRQLPEGHKPPEDIQVAAVVLGEKIDYLNKKVDAASVKVSAIMEEAGFPCCILKGQGIALAYPDSSARMPGDIDVWVMAPPRQVIAFARQNLPNAFACYHHVAFPKCDGVEVELHYRPAFLNNPIHNGRLQRWFLSETSAQRERRVELPNGAGSIRVPTNAFNRIFMMTHILNHVIHEGIGLRQMMDYYYLLQQGFTEEEQQREVQLLRRFGLYKISGAVMYVLRELFDLSSYLMLVPPDERHGRFLLNEIFRGGNFGMYAPKSVGRRTHLRKNLRRLQRDVRLLRFFPSECLWEPLFRWWHFFWRKLH